MQSIRQIERLNQTELDKCIPPNASWHTDYRDTAYVYIGGLPFELSEGDILTIFSQYGNPVHINLVRDKDTGKSRGFCFLKYEDQRSCDLAVDNLSGAGVMGRVLSVDHARYKKKEGEVEGIGDAEEEEANNTDREGDDRKKRRNTESESEEERPLIKEEIELQKLLREHDDDDPMKEYLVKEKREEVAQALEAMIKHKSRDKDRDKKHKHRHHHRSLRDKNEDDDEERRRRPRRHEEDDSDEKRRHRSRRDYKERDEHDRRHESRRNGRDEDDRDYGRRSQTPESVKGDRRREHISRRGRSPSEDGRPRLRSDEYDEDRKWNRGKARERRR